MSFITESPIIHKILKHLGLWEGETVRDPPLKTDTPEIVWIPIEDTGWAVPDQPDIKGTLPCYKRGYEDRTMVF